MNLLQKSFNKEADRILSNGTNGTNGTNGDVNESAAYKSIIDLDSVIEKYVVWAWDNSSKTKQQSKLDLDDLDMTIDWKRVQFYQDEAKFESSRRDKMPNSQTLFRTFFTNNTDVEQEYSFKTDRTTRQSCTFTFLKGFSREKEGCITFKLPQDVLEIGGGVRSEHSIEYGKDETKEQEISWGVDSQIRVAPHTCTTAELVITEQEMERAFTVECRFNGRLFVSVINKRENALIKKFGADIVEIFRLAHDNAWIPKSSSFEIIDVRGVKYVKTIVKGKCNFRLGVSQHVSLSQQPLKH